VDIATRQQGKKWIAEVWDEHIPRLNDDSDIVNTVYPEEMYVGINNWCIDTLGYHARTAYHIFEFKNKSHLDWFVLRWT
jgi:hypothetical protein